MDEKYPNAILLEARLADKDIPEIEDEIMSDLKSNGKIRINIVDGGIYKEVVFNKDMWEEAGLTEEDKPETFEEFKEVCQKIKDAGYNPLTCNSDSVNLIYGFQMARYIGQDAVLECFNNSDWDRYPLFADNYINRIAALPEEERIINIFMELSALGIAQPLSSNILEFFKALPACARAKDITFSTPSEICSAVKSVGSLDVPDTLSWVDEERDVSCWLGNAMQRDAFNKLYSVADRVRIANDPRICQDWDYLQASNNFRFMTTKPSSTGFDRGIYSSPFDAFTNYMNILGDFINRVGSLYPEEIDNEELNGLLTTIKNQGDEIEMKDKEIIRLKTKIEKMQSTEERLKAKIEKAAALKKTAARKAAAKAAEPEADAK